jgi:hypothetical protein
MIALDLPLPVALDRLRLLLLKLEPCGHLRTFLELTLDLLRSHRRQCLAAERRLRTPHHTLGIVQRLLALIACVAGNRLSPLRPVDLGSTLMQNF